MGYSLAVDLYVGRDKNGDIEFVKIPQKDKSGNGAANDVLHSPKYLTVDLVEQIHSGLFQLVSFPDGRMRLSWAGKGFYNLYELSIQDIAEEPEQLVERIHPDDRALFLNEWVACCESVRQFKMEYRVSVPEKGIVWFFCQIAPEVQPDNSVVWHGVLTDISNRKANEKRLQIARQIYQNHQQGIVVLDLKGKIVDVNDTFTTLTGFTREDAIGKTSRILRSRLYPVSFYEQMWASLETTGRWEGEFNEKRKDGEITPQWLTITGVTEADGAISHWVAQFFDISKIKEAEDTIWRQANYDDLTGLPNRRMFSDRLAQAFKLAERKQSQIALFSIDLDNFKSVNDTLGHAQGDELLIQASARIQQCVRDSDTVARFGGDEFLIFIQFSRLNIIERIAHNVLDVLSQPFQLGEENLYLGGSIGISVYPKDADSIIGLLRCADQAMYEAKNHGRNRFEYFTPHLQSAARQRALIINELRDALANKQMRVVYQPIIDFNSGKILKAEALLRWSHPKMGEISPATFIPLAEDTGLIMPIGAFVLDQVGRQLATWKPLCKEGLQIGINVSPKQLQSTQASVFDSLAECLKKHRLCGTDINIEITEGLLLNERAEVKQQLLAFQDAGIQVAIDDFGTGYSSLAYLKKFDIDYLKIDRSFVHQIRPDNDDMALCEAVIVMAHKLGLKVIAEGVETAEQMALLKSAGCDYGQGYLFARPLEADQFQALLGSDFVDMMAE